MEGLERAMQGGWRLDGARRKEDHRVCHHRIQGRWRKEEAVAPPSERGGSYEMCGGDWSRGKTKERELREDAKIRVCMGKVSGCCCMTHTFGWFKILLFRVSQLTFICSFFCYL